MSINKAIISISEMAQTVQLSRARFYQLLEQGFFPKPLIDERSKRPYYDLELQQKCLECKQSGIGADSSIMLFYSPRKNGTVPRKTEKKTDPFITELVETLESMGLSVSEKQVQQGLIEIYPDGTDDVEQGVVIRELFRHLKSN